MRISDILGMSLTNLWRRKMRTVLTVLGVIIGTASIVVMLSLGIGLKQAIMEQVSSAGGLTEIMVYSDSEYGSDALLLDDSTVETFKELENVESVEPQLSYDMPVQAGRYESYIYLLGVSDEYLEKIELGQGEMPSGKGNMSIVVGNQMLSDFYDYTTGESFWETGEMPNLDLMTTPLVGGIEEGESYDSEEDDNATSSGTESDYVDPNFSTTEADGEDGGDEETDFSSSDEETDFSDESDFSSDEYTDEEENVSYSMFSPSMKRVQLKVAGITAGDSETFTEYSYNCYTNMDALKEFLKQNYSLNEVIPGQPTDKEGKPFRDLKYSQLTVKVDASDNVEAVMDTIQNMGYRADANKEWLEETEKEFMILEAVLGGIGAVSLLVAAIGIANTMTMSTYERTKEIGIMKVLGCSLGNIRSMFLTEAAFIGMLGGVAGIGLSYILSILVNKLLAPALMSEYGAGTNISVIPIWLVLAAIVFSTLIGMIAGFFPAQRATRLSPLAAIRNE